MASTFSDIPKEKLLESIRIAAPCKADWNAMTGNEQVRFCGQCKLNVYNLSEMTRKEATDLVVAKEGKLCVRFYKRADGTVITQNCPVGLRKLRDRVYKFAAAIAGLVWFVMTMGGALAKETKNQSEKSSDQLLPHPRNYFPSDPKETQRKEQNSKRLDLREELVKRANYTVINGGPSGFSNPYELLEEPKPIILVSPLEAIPSSLLPSLSSFSSPVPDLVPSQVSIPRNIETSTGLELHKPVENTKPEIGFYSNQPTAKPTAQFTGYGCNLGMVYLNLGLKPIAVPLPLEASPPSLLPTSSVFRVEPLSHVMLLQRFKSVFPYEY